MDVKCVGPKVFSEVLIDWPALSHDKKWGGRGRDDRNI